ncbi:hypothetical protein EG329_000331 [Mollisiaceae sp. DMI_Dod_QoI]|nr:hypothetical protein EG329_000331 [Helotiales sp. DMI_Dod_QoI]
MAPLLEDPRIRQTWNQISQNAESATENAAAGIWTFQHKYINPCLSSIASSFEQCTEQCCGDRDERARRVRERGRTRGRAELSFDFYDDWDEDEDLGHRGVLGGWGNDELDRLLAGSGSHSGPSDRVDQAPRRKRGMSYGTRPRRKSLDPDPTVIPSTSALGFLGRLPFKLGGTLRYKPSAADLQEHPGGRGTEIRGEEGEPLISDHSEGERDGAKGHTRNRSSTASSGETSDSFRSRGDLFPSDGEDDAIPLDDEFAMVLERRMNITAADDRSSGKTRSSKGKRPSGSRNLSRTLSRTTQSPQSRPRVGQRASSSSVPQAADISSPGVAEVPSLTELQLEEERVRHEEESEVERKRQAAAQLAMERGLHAGEGSEVTEAKVEPPAVYSIETAEATGPEERNGMAVDTAQDVHAPTEDSVPVSSPPVMTEADKENRPPTEEEFVPARLPHFR